MRGCKWTQEVTNALNFLLVLYFISSTVTVVIMGMVIKVSTVLDERRKDGMREKINDRGQGNDNNKYWRIERVDRVFVVPLIFEKRFVTLYMTARRVIRLDYIIFEWIAV